MLNSPMDVLVIRAKIVRREVKTVVDTGASANYISSHFLDTIIKDNCILHSIPTQDPTRRSYDQTMVELLLELHGDRFCNNEVVELLVIDWFKNTS
jgi:hypothetical protein